MTWLAHILSRSGLTVGRLANSIAFTLELLKKLLDQTFASENDEFLIGLLNAAAEGTTTDYTKAHGFDFKDINWRIVQEIPNPGPYFDTRMAGGV